MKFTHENKKVKIEKAYFRKLNVLSNMEVVKSLTDVSSQVANSNISLFSIKNSTSLDISPLDYCHKKPAD